MINNVWTYLIEVMGALDEDILNATSPIQVQLVKVDSAISILSLNADQSGLIGLLRHLHQQGYLLLSVSRKKFSEGKNESGNRHSRQGGF